MINNFQNKLNNYQKSNTFTCAVCYLVFSLFIQAIFQAIAKLITQSVFQLIYERSVIVLIANYYYHSKISTSQIVFYFKSLKKQKLVCFQGIFLALQTPLVFMSIRFINMGETIIIVSTNTIWSQFLAFLILGEPFTYKRFFTIFISIFGIILIIRPPFLFGHTSIYNPNQFIGSILALIGSFIQSIVFIVFKKLGSKISSVITVQYFHFGNLVVAIVSLIYFQAEFQHDLIYLMQLLLFTILSYSAHCISFKAMSMVSFAKLAPYSFSGVVFSSIADIIVFKQPPTLLTIIGSLIVITAILLSNDSREQRKE